MIHYQVFPIITKLFIQLEIAKILL